MPTLSVCCIAKNEEKFLPDMISSVKPVASEIIILDTGSTDRTQEVAQEMGARVEKMQWSEDFAIARNRLLDRAQSEWIFMIDADERLHYDNYDRIEQALTSKHKAFQCRILNILPHPVVTSMLPLPSIRLFRRDDRVRFTGRVHESIEPSLRKLTFSAAPSPITVHHHGFTDPNQMRRFRNRRVFESELMKDPTEAWVRFHLGLSFYLDKEYAKTEEYINFVLSSQSSEILTETRSLLTVLLADIQLQQSKKLQARSFALRAVQMGGNLFAEYLLARIDMADDFYDGAIRRLLDVDAHSLSQEYFQVHKGPLYADIAKCYMKLEKYDKALQFVELAREDEPSYEAMVIGGYLYERRREYEKALQFYTLAQSIVPNSREIIERMSICRVALGK